MNPELRTPRDTSPIRGTGTARSRLLALIVSLAVMAVAGIGLAGAASAAPPAAPTVSVPVTGTAADGGAVDGAFAIQRFVVQNGALQAVGTFTGTIENAAGAVVASGSQQITMPVDLQQTTGTCDILTLVLGPLHLDLLGLVIDLNQVVLEITAEQGPGNLLGNLLCAVAGLLDGPSPLSGLAALLNRILAILG
jgi:hypothetical protein